jgi:hypothetical protein
VQQGGHAHEGQGHAAVDEGQQADHEGDLGQARRRLAAAHHGHQPLGGLDSAAADREGHEHRRAADHGRQQGRDHADGQGQQQRRDAPVGRRQIVQERRPSKLC